MYIKYYTFADKKKRKEDELGDRGVRITSAVDIRTLKHSSPELAKASDSAGLSPFVLALLLGAQSRSSRPITAGKEDAGASMQDMSTVVNSLPGTSREEEGNNNCVAT